MTYWRRQTNTTCPFCYFKRTDRQSSWSTGVVSIFPWDLRLSVTRSSPFWPGKRLGCEDYFLNGAVSCVISYFRSNPMCTLLPNFIFGAYLCLSSESDMFHTPGGRKGLTWCRQYAPFYVGSYVYEDSILSLYFTQSRRRSFCPTSDLLNIPSGLRMADDQTIIPWMLDSRKLYTEPWSNKDRLKGHVFVCYHNDPAVKRSEISISSFGGK